MDLSVYDSCVGDDARISSVIKLKRLEVQYNWKRDRKLGKMYPEKRKEKRIGARSHWVAMI